MKQSSNIKDINFICCDYVKYKNQNLHGVVFYVDPPYQKTTQYSNSSNFNWGEFWQIMRELSKTNIVLISEQNAPNDFECIWEHEITRSLNTTNKKKSTEKLFKYKM